MATPLVESAETPSADTDTDHPETIRLKMKINRGVQDRKLRNGSHMRSKRFDNLSPFLRRLVHKQMLHYEVENVASGHKYKVIWDDHVDSFVVLTIP